MISSKYLQMTADLEITVSPTIRNGYLSQRGYLMKPIRLAGKIDVTAIMRNGLLAEHDDCALDAGEKVVAD